MIHIVTALPIEAKPVIQHYRLKGRAAENGFRIYENDDMRLVISGVGKCAAAAACAYLQGIEPKGKHTWLNLGIAGHHSLDVGEAILAHKIINTVSNTAWYPPLLFTPPCKTMALMTVDQPNSNYTESVVYDMEASGFYATASRFNSNELVQVFKVISDNISCPIRLVSKKLIHKIIDENLYVLDRVLQYLYELNKLFVMQQDKPEMDPFLERWHFTVVQQHRLQRLLQQWQALAGTVLNCERFDDKKSSKAVLIALEKEIALLPVRFD